VLILFLCNHPAGKYVALAIGSLNEEETKINDVAPSYKNPQTDKTDNIVTSINYSNPYNDPYSTDGNYHIYRFDWYTEPTPKIDYFIDGILHYTQAVY